jgi:predicted DNA binding protein
VRALAGDLSDEFADAELASKRERERAGEPSTAFRASLRESLTDKQAAVLRAAFHAGYFEWPRGSTAEELADAIGVTSPTLHNHLRRAQQKLLGAFFDDAPTPNADSLWPED